MVGSSAAASTIAASGVISASGSVAGGGLGGARGGESVCDGGRGSKLLSVSTVDNDSFVSAQDTIADLGDFEAYEDIHDDFGDQLTNFLRFNCLERRIYYRQARAVRLPTGCCTWRPWNTSIATESLTGH